MIKDRNRLKAYLSNLDLNVPESLVNYWLEECSSANFIRRRLDPKLIMKKPELKHFWGWLHLCSITETHENQIFLGSNDGSKNASDFVAAVKIISKFFPMTSLI